ncbi:rad50 family protein [Aphelenchoides avenae]|nr:rad50 family protein [Aphelenchus avenae]
MASLIGLKMRGIRSIGEEEHVINFLSPLTVIQGPNGTGKTTTIEALNYITSGQLPPGRMHAFIHNNQLANKARVDALVQLKFRDVKGNMCIATKRMNACTKGAKATTKSDEFTVVIEDKFGDIRTLSSKVVDFNKEMLNLFGVPKAILDNVIFCHQEESNWPLSEPKELKSRFDAIFEVTKYSKALDYIKKMAKDLETQMKIIDAELPHLKANRLTGIKYEQQLQETTQKIDQNERQINEKEARRAQIEAELTTVRDHLVRAREKEQKMGLLHQELNFRQRTLDSLRVPDYAGSKEDLVDELDNMRQSADFRNAENQRVMVEAEIQRAEQQISNLVRAQKSTQEQISKVMADEMRKADLDNERTQMVAEITARYGLHDAVNFMESLQDKSSDLQQQMDGYSSGRGKEIGACKADKERLHTELSNLRSTESFRVKECQILAKAIRDLESDLRDVGSSSTQIRALDVELQRLQTERDMLGSEDIRHRIEELKRQRARQEDEIKQLEKLIEKEKLRQEKESEHENLLRVHKAALVKLYGALPSGEIKPGIDSMHRQVETKLRSVEVQARGADNAMNKAQQQLAQLKENIATKERELANHIGRIKQAIDDPLQASGRLTEVRAALQRLRAEHGQIGGRRVLYDKWESECVQKQACPLCERKYRSKNEAADLAKKIHQHQDNLPAEVDNLDQEIARNETEERKLMEVEPYTKLAGAIEADLPGLKLQLATAQGVVDKAKTRKTDVDSELSGLKERMQLIQSVQADASLMDNLMSTISTIQLELEQMRMDVDNMEASQWGLTDIIAEHESAQARLTALCQDIDDQEAKETRKHQVQAQINEMGSKRLSVSQKTTQVDAMKKNLEEKRKQLAQYEKEVAQAQRLLPPTQAQYEQASHALEELLMQTHAEEKRFMDEIAVIDRYCAKLEELDEKIQKATGNLNYAKGLKAQAEKLSTDLTQLQQKKGGLEQRMQDVCNMQHEIRTLEDQLQRMEAIQDIERIREELADPKWRGEPLELFLQQEQNLTREDATLNNAVQQMKGELIQLNQKILDLRMELNKKEYREAKGKYRAKFVKRAITVRIIEDLNKYHKALDNAVIKFHQHKMEQINHILRDLWARVYQGNDIETIKIKSMPVSGSEKKKSYDYSVVMTVDQTDIDMRDRCSAGQKVLASILIRVALADVFAGNCPVLALDEPTTNLDVDKVDAMGDMLRSLIEYRNGLADESSVNGEAQQGQPRHLQLIVITHDTRLVNNLFLACRPEYVYYLSKDENGVSRIDAVTNVTSSSATS